MFKKLIYAVVLLFLVNPAQAETETITREVTTNKTNISVNPVGLVFGAANVGFDHAINDSITLGAFASYWNLGFGSSEADVLGLGARFQIFAEQALTDSWYFAATLSRVTYSARNTSSGNEATAKGTGFDALVGYMWAWDHFNMQLGGGVQVVKLDYNVNSDINFGKLSGTLPTIEYRLGWAF